MLGLHRNIVFLAFSGLALSGCASAVVEGFQAAKSEVIIASNIEQAKAGDAEAQYEVGKAYCCSVHEGSGLFNTQTSVSWLCQAARQNYSPAMVMLGKIYSGDVVDGVRVARRAAQLVAGSSENVPVALAWLQMAHDRGEEDAMTVADGLWDDLSEAEQAKTKEFYAQGLDAPCDWASVIGS